MYNGVGLTTVRGTATNGYVQRNLAHSRPKARVDYAAEAEKAMAKPSLGPFRPAHDMLRLARARAGKLPGGVQKKGAMARRACPAGRASLLGVLCSQSHLWPPRPAVLQRGAYGAR